MHCNVALVKMSRYGSWLSLGKDSLIAGRVYRIIVQSLFGNKNVDRCALRLIVLLGYIEHSGSDHFRDIAQYLCETLGIILFVDIGNIALLFSFCFCVTYIIDIKAKSFRKIIESIQRKLLLQPYHHVLSID